MKEHLERIAKKVVNECMDIKEGDMVMVISGDHNLRLAEEIAVECYKVGAPPMITVSSDYYVKKVYDEVDVKHLEKVHKHMLSLLNKLNVRISIEPLEDPNLLKDVSVAKLGANRKSSRLVYDKMLKKKIRWLYLGYPTEKMANAYGIDYKHLQEMFLQMLDIDYDKLSQRANKLKKKLEGKETIRLITGENELTFSIKDRRINIDDGVIREENIAVGDLGLNLPSGEVFIAPVEDSANGTILFNCPTYRHGKRMSNIRLTFRNGRIIDVKADEGEEAFKGILKNATGACDRIAEFGIGLNPYAVPIGYTLTDEKIDKSIHIAIGENRGYGGKNRSSIHWDIVTLKPTFYADDVLIMKEGKLML
jgi:aminopeptidase